MLKKLEVKKSRIVACAEEKGRKTAHIFEKCPDLARQRKESAIISTGARKSDVPNIQMCTCCVGAYFCIPDETANAAEIIIV